MKRFVWALVSVCAFAPACGGDKEKGGGGEGGEGSGGGAVFDQATLEKLTAVEVEGFEKQPARVQKSSAMVAYTSTTPNAKGKKATVLVTLGECMMCQPMDLAKWKDNENLKMQLPAAHKDNPDLVWEVGEIDLSGKKGIYTHSLSYTETTNSSGGKSRGAANGITVFYNNGVNQMMMIVSASGGGITANNAEELAAEFSKEEAIAAAQAVFAPYASAY